MGFCSAICTRRGAHGVLFWLQGTLDAFISIARNAGVRGLWKGCVPNMQRAALVNLGDLTTYDTAKQLILKHTSVRGERGGGSVGSGCVWYVGKVSFLPLTSAPVS